MVAVKPPVLATTLPGPHGSMVCGSNHRLNNCTCKSGAAVIGKVGKSLSL
jgi:hypothetical protein